MRGIIYPRAQFRSLRTITGLLVSVLVGTDSGRTFGGGALDGGAGRDGRRQPLVPAAVASGGGPRRGRGVAAAEFPLLRRRIKAGHSPGLHSLSAALLRGAALTAEGAPDSRPRYVY